MAQSPRYRPPTLGVQVQSFTVASRLHQPHNTEDKNPKTNGETILNAKDTQRDSHNYKEKRRREKKNENRSQKNREIKPIIKPLSENEY